ncbi:thiol:disulfide interchange protein DsbA/DsbL [Teredinibacter waterburyi]|jgi:DSBA-like thioredoxin domain.|uniref:thiol:disulfide interchange protein DsbA/DsbL n=1 Tax=Teredinibacter waterburyi TaxID=1500538 RepID=UPI001FE5F1DD|nr:thiol:disulfide interchange protein DsbA/DsbL [Teredinibacter waterburyi]
MRILATATLALALVLAGCSDKGSDQESSTAMAELKQETQQAVATVSEKAKAVAKETAEAASDAATDAVETATETASDMANKASASMDSMKDAAVEAKADATNAAQDMATSVVSKAESAVAKAKSAVTTQKTFVAGKDYIELETPVKTITPGKIEVTEVFSYGCIHCFHFEPVVKAWKANMPAGVEFVQNPAVFNKSWENYARIYYTAKALGVLDKAHELVFTSIHVGHQRLLNEKEIAAMFVVNLGVEREDFDKTFKSFGVNSQIQQADARARSFKIAGTPELVVDGRYRVTSGMTGGHQQMFEVTNYLIDKIKKEQGK